MVGYQTKVMTSPTTIILAGIDFSESSPIVIRHALHAAESSGARVVALYVVDIGRLDFREASGVENPGFELLKKHAEERFAKLAGSSAERVEFVVKVGKPAEELAKLAKEVDALFLVVSANDLTKKRLGSVASRCVRIAPCDVLILRDWQGGDFKKIVICTDFSKTADHALERAAELARQDGAHLEIVNVMYPPGRDSWGMVMEHAADSPITYEEECRAVVARKMDECLKRNSEVLSGVRYESVVLESEMPSVKITGHVTSIGADLVVMGTHGHSPMASYFIGTNAERLIQDAPVSVFAIR